MLEIIIKPYKQLTLDELYALLALRSEVFVVGQQCPYQDVDYKDQEAMHLLAYEETKLVACLRILAHAENHTMSIGRVAALQASRGKGYGKQIVAAALDYLNTNHSEENIVISAQHYLLKFYSSLGFNAVGDIYDEDGIPHIRMEILR